MPTNTTGQTFTAELRQYFSIGARTRWGRKNRIGIRLSRGDMLEQIELATQMPGYHSERVTKMLAPGFYAVHAWYKHIDSYRSNAVLCTTLLAMSPWEFTAYLGRMVDTGHTNVGQFEIWFGNERDRVALAA